MNPPSSLSYGCTVLTSLRGRVELRAVGTHHHDLHGDGVLEQRADGGVERRGGVDHLGWGVLDEAVLPGGAVAEPGEARPGDPVDPQQLVGDSHSEQPHLHGLPAEHIPAAVKAHLRGRAPGLRTRSELPADRAPVPGLHHHQLRLRSVTYL